MTVNPGAGAIEGPTERAILPASLDKLARAYIATYHGPHGDAPVSDAATGPVDMGAAGKVMSPNLLSALVRSAQERGLRPATTRQLLDAITARRALQAAPDAASGI